MSDFMYPAPLTDATLTQDGYPADAKAVGEALNCVFDISSKIAPYASGITINDKSVYVAGNVVSAYMVLSSENPLKRGFIVKGLPKPIWGYAIASCCDEEGNTIGSAWLYPDGTLRTPSNFEKKGYFFICYITREYNPIIKTK